MPYAAPDWTARPSSRRPSGYRARNLDARIGLIEDRHSFRRHDNACCYYRENWILDDSRRTDDGELVLYEVYCLQGMPPATADEQAQCFQRRTHCWRTGELLSKMPPVPGMPKRKAGSRSS